MDPTNRVQILEEAVGISNLAYTFVKGMNPIILQHAIGKQLNRLEYLR